jgi:hypothetical protein
MNDLEKRLHRAMGGMIGNESLAESLDQDAAGVLFSWGESAAKYIVDQTDGMDDEAAEEHMTPRLRALRLMMRAIGRWVGEAKSLDSESRLALWNRAEGQAKVLFGETFSLPPMDESLSQLQADANAGQWIAWLKNFMEEKGNKG